MPVVCLVVCHRANGPTSLRAFHGPLGPPQTMKTGSPERTHHVILSDSEESHRPATCYFGPGEILRLRCTDANKYSLKPAPAQNDIGRFIFVRATAKQSQRATRRLLRPATPMEAKS